MKLLAIYSVKLKDGCTPHLIKQLSDPVLIEAELTSRGILVQRWSVCPQLPGGCDSATILETYAEQVATVQSQGCYPVVDVIRLYPDHPDRASLRQTFMVEHTHDEDEVRYFVEGGGLYSLHLGDAVLQLLCEAGDWLAVPAGTRHWFDMGAEPLFCALRFFNNPAGWVAQVTEDSLADNFPTLVEHQTS